MSGPVKAHVMKYLTIFRLISLALLHTVNMNFCDCKGQEQLTEEKIP